MKLFKIETELNQRKDILYHSVSDLQYDMVKI